MDQVYKQLEYIAAELNRVETQMIDPREFGRLEGAVASLKTELDDVKAKQATMDGKLDQVLAALGEAKGGWKMLVMLGGAGAALGGAITWFFTHTIHITPKG